MSDGDGGAFVGWVDTRNDETDIYVQRFNAGGEIVSGWPADGRAVCSAILSQYHLDVAADGAGGAYLVWEDFRGGRSGDIYLQRIDAAGSPSFGWPVNGRPICAVESHQGVPRVVADGSGGAFVVWQDLRSGVPEVYAQRVESSGSPSAGWPENGALLATGTSPTIAALNDGRVAVVWHRQVGASAFELRAAVCGQESPAGGWPPGSLTLAVDAEDLGGIAIARGSNAIFVSWSEKTSAGPRLSVQRLVDNAGLSTTWTSGGVTLREGHVGRGAPTLAAMPDGGAIALWEDFRDPTQSDIFAARVNSDGEVSPGWSQNGVAVCLAAGDQYAPMLADSDTTGSITTWADANAATSGIFLNAGSVSQLAPRLLRATATPGRARIVWTASPRAYPDYRVDRRIGDGEWARFGVTALTESLQVVVDDRAAPEGQTVSYRLAVEIPDAEIIFDEVALSVPRTPLELTLRFARAVGSDQSIHVSFALPRGNDAKLELMDIAGRRVAEQSLAGLEPGEHEVSFRLRSRIASGVYFVRLIQAKVARSAKVIYVK